MKVLFATDGSSHAQQAAWLLSHLPHREPLELAVLTVMQTPSYVNTPRVNEEWYAESMQRERQFANATFQRTAELFEGADVRLHQITREGSRGQEIVDEAKQRGADLIVVGARGHSAVDRILLGSTSDFVATHADCSVLVVRPTGLQEAPDRPLRVALAFDGSPASQTAIEQFRRFVWGPRAELHVVHIVSYVSGLLTEMPVDRTVIRTDAAAGVEQAVESLRTVAPHGQGHLIESDHVGEGLTRFVEQQKCDLVVLGDTGRGGLSRFFLGSVSRFVLRHAGCSVWITRQPANRHGSAGSAESSADAAR